MQKSYNRFIKTKYIKLDLQTKKCVFRVAFCVFNPETTKKLLCKKCCSRDDSFFRAIFGKICKCLHFIFLIQFFFVTWKGGKTRAGYIEPGARRELWKFDGFFEKRRWWKENDENWLFYSSIRWLYFNDCKLLLLSFHRKENVANSNGFVWCVAATWCTWKRNFCLLISSRTFRLLFAVITVIEDLLGYVAHACHVVQMKENEKDYKVSVWENTVVHRQSRRLKCSFNRLTHCERWAFYWKRNRLPMREHKKQ